MSRFSIATILKEARRRRVFRVAALYIVGAWAVLQASDLAFPALNIPENAIGYIWIGAIIGFPIALFFGWRYEVTDGQIVRTKRASADPDLSLKRADYFILSALSVVAIVVVTGLIREISETQVLIPEQTQDTVYDPTSIAVLPFANTSSDPEQEYFSDGLTEEMLNLLARLPELRVTSRSTAFTFKGKSVAVTEAAREMNVAHILEGSVRKAGDQIRIAVQLIDARTDTQLWSSSYNRKLDDVFAIQNEIAAMVVSELKLELLDGPPKAEEIDPRAFELYLQARHIIHTADQPERVQEAIEKLQQMLEYEPDFVPAIWELARAHLRNAQYSGDPATWDESHNKIRVLAARLVEIAPNSSYANGWLYYIARNLDQDYQKAVVYLERAVSAAVDSNMYIQLLSASIVMRELDRLEEALEIAFYVVSRDPACKPCVSNLAYLLRLSGRARESAERLETILNWTDGSPRIYLEIGFSWLTAEEPEIALQYFNRAGDSAGAAAGRLGALYHLGPIEQFESRFQTFREEYSNRMDLIAAIYAISDQNDEAFEMLDKMVQLQGRESAFVINSEIFNRLRSDTRWQRMVERYDVAGPDLSHIAFNPILPKAIQSNLNSRRDVN